MHTGRVSTEATRSTAERLPVIAGPAPMFRGLGDSIKLLLGACASRTWPAPLARAGLHPDVFLGDSAVAPVCHGHHAAAVLEFSDHACPLIGPEPDRMGLDLRWCPACCLDYGLHGVDVFVDAVGWRLIVDVDQNVVGVVVGEQTVPVGSVPCRKVQVVHAI